MKAILKFKIINGFPYRVPHTSEFESSRNINKSSDSIPD